MDIINPRGWPRPRGYSNGIKSSGEMIFIAGQIGWDETETIVSDDFAEQFHQALQNVIAVLDAGGGKPEHIVRLTGYVTSREDYLAAGKLIGASWKELMGRNYPVMSFVIVAGLIEERAKVELEATAVLPA